MKSQLIVFFAAVVCSVSAIAQISEEITIEPNKRLQAEIDRAVLAMIEGQGQGTQEDWDRLFELQMQRLLDAVQDNQKFLMRQTIFWASQPKKPPINDYRKLILGRFLFWLDIAEEECVEIVLPYLTNRTPYNVRYLAQRTLGHIYVRENDAGSTIYDFSFFAVLIANDSGRDPRGLDNLIDFIYYEGPGEAVLALMRAHGASSGEIAAMEEAEKWLGPMYRRGFRRESDPAWDFDRIMGYLDYYSQSEHWWERLYAATMLGEVRQLRTDPVLRRLKSDWHPVVRGKLEGVHPKDER